MAVSKVARGTIPETLITIVRHEVIGCVTAGEGQTHPVDVAFAMASDYIARSEGMTVRLEWEFEGDTFTATREPMPDGH